MKWHERFDKINEETSGLRDNLDVDNGGLDELTESVISLPQESIYNRQYIKQKLMHGLNRIWQVRCVWFCIERCIPPIQ